VTFADDLLAGRFPVALEITPPQRPRTGVLLRRAGLLGSAASAVNVIQRPGRQCSLHASIDLTRQGIPPVWHLATRGLTAETLARDLAEAQASGIRQVLVVRGDQDGEGALPTPDMPIRDVIARVRGEVPSAFIGATFNPYVATGGAALRNLAAKVRAGAGYVQTQPLFNVAAVEPQLEQVRALAPDLKVVAMAMPLLDEASATRISVRLGIRLPDTILRAAGHGGGWQTFAATLAAMVQSPLIDGVAIMTFEMDPSPETGAQIVDALAAAGAIDSARAAT
jgi:methylenetetrahydrofolate reductase (NADPH)